MHWLIEHSYKEYNYLNFLNAISNLDHTVCKVFPFLDRLVPLDYEDHVYGDDTPEVEYPSTNCVGFGTVSFGKIVQKRNIQPGIFTNENFNARVWNKEYGDHVLNSDAIVTTVAEAPKYLRENFGTEIFIRPALDNKAFTGKVFKYSTLYAFLEMHTVYNKHDELSPINLETEIVLAAPKRIMQEYRVFVVNGVPVTSSLYKLGEEVMYKNSDDEKDIMEFAQQLIDIWTPHIAFVMDICRTSNGLKLVEINTINTAGFYDINLYKFIDAIESLTEGG